MKREPPAYTNTKKVSTRDQNLVRESYLTIGLSLSLHGRSTM